MSLVSAANDTDTVDADLSDSTVTNDTIISNSELITKKTSDEITKTSTNQTTKAASKVSVNSLKIQYDSSAKLSAKVINAKTGKNVTSGKVVFKINGNTVGYSNVKNGVVSYVYNATGLTPKNYTITVKYGETSELLSSSANATLTVLKTKSNIVIKNSTVLCNDKVKLTALVTGSNGKYATSGKVAFKINGKTVGYANVTNGKAVFTYTANLGSKTYKLNASYGGNNCYNSSRSSMGYLTVTKRPVKLTVIKVSCYSTTVVLKAKVVDKNTSKNITSGLVVFKINDKTVGNASISKGLASLTYNSSQLARGTYKISAILQPTSYYLSANATNNLTIKAETSFTYAQIQSAAVDVRTQFEANKSVLTVYISKSRIGLSDFLALMIQTADNVKKGKSSTKVPFKQYNTLTTQSDSLKTGILNTSQILDVGNRTLTFMNANNRPPKYSSTVLGNMGYFNIAYSYSKILDLSTSKYLPSTCKVYNWASIHPTNPKSRTIYITSDAVISKTKDYVFMNNVKNALEAKGYNVIISGYGSNSHNTAIWNQSLPVNAVQLSIFGGADAGVIYDMGTRSFMRTKENRLIFLVYNPITSKDITGLTFLERAHDDNYSSSSFKGLSNPDIYLKDHGYDYVYSNNINKIVNSLISYIS